VQRGQVGRVGAVRPDSDGQTVQTVRAGQTRNRTGQCVGMGRQVSAYIRLDSQGVCVATMQGVGLSGVFVWPVYWGGGRVWPRCVAVCVVGHDLPGGLVS
jgi:hypothetical protein